MIKYVVHHNGSWAVKNAKADRVTKIFKTQKEAIRYASSLESTSTIMVQSRTGSFRSLSKWDLTSKSKGSKVVKTGLIDNKNSSYYWREKDDSISFSSSTDAQVDNISQIVKRLKNDVKPKHQSSITNSNLHKLDKKYGQSDDWKPVEARIPGFDNLKKNSNKQKITSENFQPPINDNLQLPIDNDSVNKKLVVTNKVDDSFFEEEKEEVHKLENKPSQNDIVVSQNKNTNSSLFASELVTSEQINNFNTKQYKKLEKTQYNNEIPEFNETISIKINSSDITKSSLVAPMPVKKKTNVWKITLMIFILFLLSLWFIYSILVAYNVEFAINLYDKLPLWLQIVK